MDQVKIGVEPSATVQAFQLAETTSKARWETGNEIRAYKSI
jgi:hypothetical protein